MGAAKVCNGCATVVGQKQESLLGHVALSKTVTPQPLTPPPSSAQSPKGAEIGTTTGDVGLGKNYTSLHEVCVCGCWSTHAAGAGCVDQRSSKVQIVCGPFAAGLFILLVVLYLPCW